MRNYNLLAWEHLGWSGMCHVCLFSCCPANHLGSSAKDQLTGQAVAVKKIMKPFSTPVLAKRTYRELKLLKHLRHENVSFGLSTPNHLILLLTEHRLLVSATSSSRPSRTCKPAKSMTYLLSSLTMISYFVTELLGTDLHRLLTSRPLEKQFIQYFLYQILV